MVREVNKEKKSSLSIRSDGPLANILLFCGCLSRKRKDAWFRFFEIKKEFVVWVNNSRFGSITNQVDSFSGESFSWSKPYHFIIECILPPKRPRLISKISSKSKKPFQSLSEKLFQYKNSDSVLLDSRFFDSLLDAVSWWLWLSCLIYCPVKLQLQEDQNNHNNANYNW